MQYFWNKISISDLFYKLAFSYFKIVVSNTKVVDMCFLSLYKLKNIDRYPLRSFVKQYKMINIPEQMYGDYLTRKEF